jgi:hypothetical protein
MKRCSEFTKGPCGRLRGRRGDRDALLVEGRERPPIVALFDLHPGLLRGGALYVVSGGNVRPLLFWRVFHFAHADQNSGAAALRGRDLFCLGAVEVTDADSERLQHCDRSAHLQDRPAHSTNTVWFDERLTQPITPAAFFLRNGDAKADGVITN